jgi:NADH-quinone oxidoreductase subunit M
MSLLTSNMLSLLIFLPLVAAFVTYITPARYTKQVALGLSLIPLALCMPLFLQFNASLAGLQFTESHTWLPAFNIHYALGIDGLALPLIGLTALLTPLCLIASWHVQKNPQGFFAAFLALESFVIGVFSAQDFILFYLFWEAMLIPMFLLIGLWGGENRVYAAIKFFLYTFVGSVLMLIAGLWLYNVTGSFSLEVWQNTVLPLGAQKWLFLAFFAAFAVKVPMFPFHTWLPDAHVQAPTAGSVILAGVLLKMGAYGFLRFCLPMFPEGSAYFAPMVFTLSAIAVVYAAFIAYVQTDIKKMIAYSSVSHMGFVTLAAFSGTVTGLHGSLLVMLNHGIVSAGLFLGVGVIYERLHTRQLSNFGALAKIMPAYAFVMMILTLAAVALPGTNSFVGEFLALLGSWPTAPIYTAIATTGVVFGALYMLHLYRGMFYGDASETVLHHVADLKDLTCREWLTFLPLLALIPLLGVMPSLAQNLWQQPVQSISAEYLPALQARIAHQPGIPQILPETEQLSTPIASENVSPQPVSTTTVSATTVSQTDIIR